MPSPSDLHNAMVANAVRTLFRPLLEAGASAADIMVATESIAAAGFLVAVKLGGDEPVADVFVEGLRRRLAEIRLNDLPAAGEG